MGLRFWGGATKAALRPLVHSVNTPPELEKARLLNAPTERGTLMMMKKKDYIITTVYGSL